eukprot:97066-Prorocentrum_minimum.AAC.2
MLMPVGSRLVVSRDSFWRSTRNDSGLCHISEELHLSQLSSPSGCPPADADLPMCNGSSIADRELREGDMQWRGRIEEVVKACNQAHEPATAVWMLSICISARILPLGSQSKFPHVLTDLATPCGHLGDGGVQLGLASRNASSSAPGTLRSWTRSSIRRATLSPCAVGRRGSSTLTSVMAPRRRCLRRIACTRAWGSAPSAIWITCG